MGNIGIWQLLIVVAIVVLLFGTKKLRGLGSDLGSAVKGFKKAIADDDMTKNNETDGAESIANKASADKSVEKKDKEHV